MRAKCVTVKLPHKKATRRLSIAMNSVTQDMKFRQSLLKYSQKYGVTKAAIKYKTNRQYIYRWLRRYDGTIDSLREKSRRPHHHPNQHTEQELKLIGDFGVKIDRKSREPYWRAHEPAQTKFIFPFHKSFCQAFFKKPRSCRVPAATRCVPAASPSPCYPCPRSRPSVHLAFVCGRAVRAAPCRARLRV